MTKLFWKCPSCKSEVDFLKQMSYIFEDGEADFDPSRGMFHHTINCDECPAAWSVSISKPYNEE